MFEVGDVVMAYAEDAPYRLTKGNWVGQVVEVSGFRMTVETIVVRRGKEDNDSPGRRYDVSPQYFCLAK